MDELDPITRTRVLMALLGFAVLLLGFVVVTMLGGRYVRRLAREPSTPSRRGAPRGTPVPRPPAPPDSPPET
jgi:hypothetical protein